MHQNASAQTKTDITIAPIIKTLERDIIFGEILPRERILEDEIVYRFDVKRHIARRVLDVLAQKGMLMKVPNKGSFVRHFSHDEMLQVYEVREALHHAGALLIKLPADETWLARLEAVHRQHAKATAEKDLDQVYRSNIEFHRTLFEGMQNSHFVDAIEHSNTLTHCIRSHALNDPDLMEKAHKEHEQMILCLKQGRLSDLADLCVTHMHPARRFYERKFCGLK